MRECILAAYGLLQIPIEHRDDEWEDDRLEWLEKYEPVVSGDGAKEPLIQADAKSYPHKDCFYSGGRGCNNLRLDAPVRTA